MLHEAGEPLALAGRREPLLAPLVVPSPDFEPPLLEARELALVEDALDRAFLGRVVTDEEEGARGEREHHEEEERSPVHCLRRRYSCRARMTVRFLCLSSISIEMMYEFSETPSEALRFAISTMRP